MSSPLWGEYITTFSSGRLSQNGPTPIKHSNSGFLYFLLVLGDILRVDSLVCVCLWLRKGFGLKVESFVIFSSPTPFFSPPPLLPKITSVCWEGWLWKWRRNLKTMFFIWFVISSKLFHSKEAGNIRPLPKSTATPETQNISFKTLSKTWPDRIDFAFPSWSSWVL